jgi:predicted site-specific integrase-resolvase
MKTYSTKQAAKRAGIHWVTLLRWVEAGKVRASQRIRLDGVHHWRWTERDIEQLRKYKTEHYGRWPKGGGKKGVK